jgi:hypothetical protein
MFILFNFIDFESQEKVWCREKLLGNSKKSIKNAKLRGLKSK